MRIICIYSKEESLFHALFLESDEDRLSLAINLFHQLQLENLELELGLQDRSELLVFGKEGQIRRFVHFCEWRQAIALAHFKGMVANGPECPFIGPLNVMPKRVICLQIPNERCVLDKAELAGAHKCVIGQRAR